MRDNDHACALLLTDQPADGVVDALADVDRLNVVVHVHDEVAEIVHEEWLQDPEQHELLETGYRQARGQREHEDQELSWEESDRVTREHEEHVDRTDRSAQAGHARCTLWVVL